ncbi:MAG TPA: transposase [Victivallales bacterium]|nr:transposase [Victivallales bacterium]
MDIETICFTRRKLPHWQVRGKSYFVTFRLRNSIPKSIVLKLKSRREEILSGAKNDEKVYEFQRKEFIEIENILDSARTNENYFLADEKIAQTIINSFAFIENKYCWSFPSFVIMPNHVHCLCVANKSGEKISLTKAFSILKQYTARQINKILGRKGQRVWCDENFDHWCRNAHKEENVKRYIENNPVKANLVKKPEEWKWKK